MNEVLKTAIANSTETREMKSTSTEGEKGQEIRKLQKKSAELLRIRTKPKSVKIELNPNV